MLKNAVESLNHDKNLKVPVSNSIQTSIEEITLKNYNQFILMITYVINQINEYKSFSEPSLSFIKDISIKLNQFSSNSQELKNLSIDLIKLIKDIIIQDTTKICYDYVNSMITTDAAVAGVNAVAVNDTDANNVPCTDANHVGNLTNIVSVTSENH